MDRHLNNQSAVLRKVSALFSISYLKKCLVPPGDFFEHAPKDWRKFIAKPLDVTTKDYFSIASSRSHNRLYSS